MNFFGVRYFLRTSHQSGQNARSDSGPVALVALIVNAAQ